ncbi:MAG: 50S ribosomal protein L15 [Alphaproteobacteria bacterium]|jgi:large subunit ribosomal protein L15|nr:50S ribosomal protein L15 [Alphaproteobacteria bacterium]
MKLNELADNPGARKSRMRVGRGIGSGKGKTAGRGVKGQKSRSGVAIKGFEGGQMPIHRRLPKRGFKKPNQVQYAELTLDKLVAAIAAQKVDGQKLLNEADLVASGVVRRKKDGIRLIGTADVNLAVTVEVSGVTAGARRCIESAGGAVNVVVAKQVEGADNE